MTIEERAEGIVTEWSNAYLVQTDTEGKVSGKILRDIISDELRTAVAQAVEEERKRCARIALGYPRPHADENADECGSCEICTTAAAISDRIVEGMTVDEASRETVAQAVAEEREACAKIAVGKFGVAGDYISEYIRARAAARDEKEGT